jgi:hypothetical protein
LLLEHNQQRLYTIKVPKIVNSKTAITDNALSTSNNSSAFALMFLLSFIVAGYFWYSKKNTIKKQRDLHEQWAKIEFDKTKKLLFLYKRHTKTAELTLNLSAITRSDVLLNDEVISTQIKPSSEKLKFRFPVKSPLIVWQHNQLLHKNYAPKYLKMI